MKHDWDMDHIDPKWAEGRDYQLVCGLDVMFNMCDRDRTLNQRKSNRFLPWRVGKDDCGGVPIERGDWCLFLDPDTNEWVLEEFMGSWWFEKSKKYNGSSQKKAESHKEKISATLTGHSTDDTTKQKQREATIGRKHTNETKEKIKNNHARPMLGKKHSAETRMKMREARERYEAQKRCKSMSMTDPLMPNFED